MGANDKQYGGGHYKGADYQHWDFVTDIRLPYLPAVATKYASRWRKKGGDIDLLKLKHYLEKCIEVGERGSSVNDRHDKFWKFVRANNIDLHSASIIFSTMEGQYQRAIELTLPLLEQPSQDDRTGEPTATQLHP